MPAASMIKVFVVDDQLSIRTLVRTALNTIGIKEIREFPSADDAAQAIAAEPPHIILSDYNMPGMDGLAFLRAIRANPQFKQIAFILLTGRADRELVMRAAQFGANNYLVKPFTTDSLKKKIEAVVGALS